MCNTKSTLVILTAVMGSRYGGLKRMDSFTPEGDTIIDFSLYNALRFFLNYFNNDVYYKVNYPEHNLNRARNQFKLIKNLSEKIENQK